MFRVATLPSWECKTPAAYRRRGERYWARAELPLSEEWTFIVNVAADQEPEVPERSLVAIGTEQVLAVIEEVGASGVKSVYHLARGLPGDEYALMINRLTHIEVGEDSEDGWRKVLIFGIENGPPLTDQRDEDAISRLTNRVEVARFSSSTDNSPPP